MIRETLAKGGRAYRPRIAHPTLAAAFIDPALALSRRPRRRACVRPARCARIVLRRRRASIALEFPERTIALSADDAVILAVPPWVAQELAARRRRRPTNSAPSSTRISRCAAPAGAPLMLGVIGGTAEWIFSFPDRIPSPSAARTASSTWTARRWRSCLWRDVATALTSPARRLPPWQIVKESRATFAATPEQAAKRRTGHDAWPNLFLAGDWTATGPARDHRRRGPVGPESGRAGARR